jgi:hypothetical protein
LEEHLLNSNLKEEVMRQVESSKDLFDIKSIFVKDSLLKSENGELFSQKILEKYLETMQQ